MNEFRRPRRNAEVRGLDWLSNPDCEFAGTVRRSFYLMGWSIEQSMPQIWMEWRKHGFLLPHTLEAKGFDFRLSLGDHRPCYSQPCSGCYVGQWLLIWKHAIECNYAACYNTLFENLLCPHFNSPHLLDFMLGEALIKPKPNVLRGRTGALVFPHLLQWLVRFEGPEMQRYVAYEFGRYIPPPSASLC